MKYTGEKAMPSMFLICTIRLVIFSWEIRETFFLLLLRDQRGELTVESKQVRK